MSINNTCNGKCLIYYIPSIYFACLYCIGVHTKQLSGQVSLSYTIHSHGWLIMDVGYHYPRFWYHNLCGVWFVWYNHWFALTHPSNSWNRTTKLSHPRKTIGTAQTERFWLRKGLLRVTYGLTQITHSIPTSSNIPIFDQSGDEMATTKKKRNWRLVVWRGG